MQALPKAHVKRTQARNGIMNGENKNCFGHISRFKVYG